MTKVKVTQKVNSKDPYISEPQLLAFNPNISDRAITFYGFCEYRYNLTANNILNFYDYYLDYPYIVVPRKEYMKLRGIKSNSTMSKIYNDLTNTGWIQRKKRMHRWEIRLPREEHKISITKKQAHIINKRVKEKTGHNSKFIQSTKSVSMQGTESVPMQSTDNVPNQSTESVPVYNNKNSNIQNPKIKNCNVVGSSYEAPKTDNTKHQTKGSKKLPKWIKDCLFNINRKFDYQSISKSKFYNVNSNNPFIKDGSLDKFLNDPMDKDLSKNDLKKDLKAEYKDYINSNSDIPLKSETASPKPKQNQSVPDYLKGNPEKLAPGEKLHPTDHKTQAKIQKQLHDLNKGSNSKSSKPNNDNSKSNTKDNIKNSNTAKNKGNHKLPITKDQRKFIKNHKKEYETIKPQIIKKLKSDQDDLPFNDGHENDDLDDDYKALIVPKTIKAIKKHYKEIAKKRQDKIDEQKQAKEQKEEDQDYEQTIKNLGVKDTVPSNDLNDSDDLPF